MENSIDVNEKGSGNISNEVSGNISDEENSSISEEGNGSLSEEGSGNISEDGGGNISEEETEDNSKRGNENINEEEASNIDEEESIIDDEDNKSESDPINIQEDMSKAGVVYLSRIPTMMNVKKLCEIFDEYGKIGRVFLKPDEKVPSSKKNRIFAEGWVEFKLKKTAKLVAHILNNKQVGGKRKNPWYHELWNIKYLHKFKWIHLNEKLAYERAVRKQKLKVEIRQAKKMTNKFIEQVEKQKKKRKNLNEEDKESSIKPFVFRQSEVQNIKKVKKDNKIVAFDNNFLKNILSGGMNE